MTFPHKSWAKGDMNVGGEATTTNYTVTLPMWSGDSFTTGLWYACDTSPFDPQLTILGRNEIDGSEGALTCDGVTSWRPLGNNILNCMKKLAICGQFFRDKKV